MDPPQARAPSTCSCKAAQASRKPRMQGLEREYDRLLAEHDKLRRAYDQATGGRVAQAPSYKKAE